MKYILVLDRADEQRMQTGEMIPIPGQLETFLTMEPRRGSRASAAVEADTPESPMGERRRRAPLRMVQCPDCGQSFKGRVGVSTHSRNCPGRKREPALPTPSAPPSASTCAYCARSFPSINARNAHLAACPAKPRTRKGAVHV